MMMLFALVGGLLSGFPVAFVLPGIALLFAFLGASLGAFDLTYIHAWPERIFGIMMNELLLAVPLFIFMGVCLEKARIAEELLETMAKLFKGLHGGMALSVVVVGALLGASTGIVGATVVTMGLISLPAMLHNKYGHSIACGTICAAGTLGQIIPPSIVLILLGDQLSSAYQNAQMQIGNFAPEPLSVADLFVGALLPGLMLVLSYMAWIVIYGYWRPNAIPRRDSIQGAVSFRQTLRILLPPLLLIIIVLGSILAGIATATEAASIGAVGAMILAAFHRRLNRTTLHDICVETATVTCMIFAILIGAALFTLVFRGYGGDEMIHALLADLPGGLFTAMLVVMLAMFLLGFFLDFIEIIFVVVPIVAPALFLLGANPIWLGVMIAINLQTSFLTPPFGFSLFYLRGVAPKRVKTTAIYHGAIPFVIIQLLMLLLIAAAPQITTWLPGALYETDFSGETGVLPPSLPEVEVEQMIDF